MWQRIQTLYLAVALGLCISLFFVKAVTIIGPGGEVERIYFYEKIGYLIMTVIMSLGALAALSSFKVRLLQMRLCVIAGLIAIGFQGWIVYDILTSEGGMVFNTGAIFPSLIFIFEILAANAALKDEILVKSSGRIRSK